MSPISARIVNARTGPIPIRPVKATAIGSPRLSASPPHRRRARPCAPRDTTARGAARGQRRAPAAAAASHARARGRRTGAGRLAGITAAAAARGSSAPAASAVAPVDAARHASRSSRGSPAAELDADHALAPQRIGQAPGIEPIGLRGEPRFQLRLPRIDDTDRRAGRRQRIDERPRRPTRFHRHRRAASTPRATNRATLRRPRKATFPPRSPVGVIAHAWKNALCKSMPIYSRSMGCPLTARSMRVENTALSPVPRVGDGPFI